MVLSHTPEPVGVGSPNPLGKETSPLRWMTAPQIVPPFAPEERYVRFVSITDQYGFGEGG